MNLRLRKTYPTVPTAVKRVKKGVPSPDNQQTSFLENGQISARAGVLEVPQGDGAPREHHSPSVEEKVAEYQEDPNAPWVIKELTRVLKGKGLDDVRGVIDGVTLAFFESQLENSSLKKELEEKKNTEEKLRHAEADLEQARQVSDTLRADLEALQKVNVEQERKIKSLEEIGRHTTEKEALEGAEQTVEIERFDINESFGVTFNLSADISPAIFDGYSGFVQGLLDPKEGHEEYRMRW